MRLLVVGGSGLVGSLVLPYLAAGHEVRVLDLVEPRVPVSGVDYHVGDLHDVDLVERLADGVDSLVFMAMGPGADWGSPPTARAHLEVAVPGLYATITGVHRAGVTHLVYASSMSVYRFPFEGDFPPPGQEEADDRIGRYPDESTPPNSRDFYGLAKRLGEEVCRTATEWGMDAVCLRLCFPTADDAWPRKGTAMQRAISTSARDVAAAFEAALARRGQGFDAYAISGDGAERTMSLARTKRELGWWPQDNTAEA